MVTKTLLTADDLLKLPENGKRYELVRGELVEMSPASTKHGRRAARLAARLLAHVEAHNLGDVVVESGFCLECRPDTVRSPDVAFIAVARLANGLPEEGFFPGAPDLAVEIVSPGDLDSEVQEKVLDYLRSSLYPARRVWVIRPKLRMVTVHYPDGTARTLQENDILDGEDVVPGFACRVGELF